MTSANLGNMISMAFASLYLPFLPLTANQILLNNLLSDVPAVGFADDNVDPEMVEQPPHWDMRFIGRFMVEFVVLSSAFDFLTFGLLLIVFQASVAIFRTAWFVESLFWSTVAMVIVAFAIPYLPFTRLLGFVPLSRALFVALMGVTLLYVVSVELNKLWFYRARARRTAP